MRIINVIETVHGSVGHIKSYCVQDEMLAEDVIESAKKDFKSILNSKFKISEENMGTHIEDGYFDDYDSGYVLSIVWSDETY